MTNLKEQFDTTNLDELCNTLTQEITQLATSDYKLKLMFVLVHIIEESQKALGEIDINNMVKELKTLVEKTCKKTENQLEINKLRHTQNKEVKDIIDGTNKELKTLDDEMESILFRYENELQKMVKLRDNLSIPERETNQQR
jgi:transcriptional regulator with AAA-type ATPase domain